MKRFLDGDCLFFALAFYERYGGIFLALRDDARACEPLNKTEIPIPLLHVWVMLDNGDHYDARGQIGPDATLDLYGEGYKKQHTFFREPDLHIWMETRDTLVNIIHTVNDESDEKRAKMIEARRYILFNSHLFPPLPAGRSRVLTQAEGSEIMKRTAG